MARSVSKLEVVPLGLVCAIIVLAACGGGGERKTAMETTAAAPAPGATTPAPSTGPTPGAPPAGATPQMVALGDSIYHGQAAGGLCYTCHGMDAKGTPLAPPLTQHKWLTGDGSYEFLQKRITEGMPNPTPPYTSPMLPKGGSPLTDDQIKAVAAYVYSISR